MTASKREVVSDCVKKQKKKKKEHLLPEDFCGAQVFTSGAVPCVVTESCIGYSITGPGQWALEGAAQVVKRPCYDDVVVQTHQRGHTEHPNANTYSK